jgi:alpha-glucosidase (family GH31 glycosyl hydrolase)
MKLLSLVLLLTAISASSSYASHPTKLVEKNSVVLGHARFTVLAPEAIRMEYSPSDHFVDLPSLFAAKRTSELTAEESAVLKISVSGNTLTINTGKILLTYTNDGQWFRAGNPSAVITDSEHHFTANWTFGQKGSSNLGGTLNSLDHVAGPMPLKDGLLSKDGWYYIDDNGRFLIDTSDGSDFEHGFVKARDDWQHADGVDGFLFGYGLNYHSALKALTRVSGDIPMPRRYTLGAWYSRWWKYTSQDYRDIVEQFHQHDFPLDMIVMDMDWHQTPDYTGLSWNRALLPDAEQLLKDFHHEGLHVTLNDHPAGGVMPTETTYDAFMRAMGQDPATKAVIPYDAGNRKYLETLLGMTHTPLEKEGVDFWWVDWMGDSSHKFNQLDWINEYYFRHSEQSIPELNLRGQSFSRWADWGDQRHPIHFSGDTKILWSVLQFEVPFTSTAANVGCFYWSNDIGGFIDDTSEMNAIFKIKQGELIARWTQFGAVSPILRLHSANREWLDKRPWVYPSNIERSMQVSFHLRSEIFPYIYSSAWAEQP